MSAKDMLKASFERNCPCYESREYKGKMHCANVRYLLIMTEEYSALPIIEEMYLKGRDNVNVIFGSSFPKDQEFAQVIVYIVVMINIFTKKCLSFSQSLSKISRMEVSQSLSGN